jgi:WD40 repeat protein
VCAGEPRSQLGRDCRPELTLWDTATWLRTRLQPVPDGAKSGKCTGLAFHPDGVSVASSWQNSNRIIIFKISESGASSTINVDRPLALGFSPDGTRLWSAAGERVREWSVPELRELPGWTNLAAKVLTGRDNITSFAVRQNWMLAGGRDGSVSVFGASEFPQRKDRWVCSEQPVTSLAVDAAGQIVAAGTQDGVITLLRLPSGEPIARQQVVQRGTIEVLAFSADGRLFVSGAQDHTIQLWHVVNDSLVELLTLRSRSGPIHSAKFSPDGQRLFTVAHGEPAVRVWHLDVIRRTLKPLGLDWD